MNFFIDPHPNVVLSDADEKHLPLRYFDLVLIVEPDPETYMLLPGEVENLNFRLKLMYDNINEETDPDSTVEYAISLPADKESPHFVWLCYSGDHYFDDIADLVLASATFKLMDYDDLDHLSLYLKGVTMINPHWKAAVIGGMYEDDVMRIANLVQEAGLDVTVLTRYCISNVGFVNLDELSEYKAWQDSYGTDWDEDDSSK